MSQIPTTFSRTALGLGLLCAGLALAQEPRASAKPGRITRPEGYLQIEGDDGGLSGAGTFSVQPEVAWPDAGPLADSPPADSDDGAPQEIPPPAPVRKTAEELCQPIAERFAQRLAELRGTPVGGGVAMAPMLQRAIFGRVALKAEATNPDDEVPELTYDSQLKDLKKAYRKCLKAERRR